MRRARCARACAVEVKGFTASARAWTRADVEAVAAVAVGGIFAEAGVGKRRPGRSGSPRGQAGQGEAHSTSSIARSASASTRVGRLGGVEQRIRSGSARASCVVGGGDAREEGARPRAPGGRAAARGRRWRARPAAGEMRSSSVRSGSRPPVAKQVDRADLLDAELASGALVGQRGVDEAVEQDERAVAQQRRAGARATSWARAAA